MKLVKQPNGWSCLPTSFAMVLGIDLGTIIAEIGHDGSELLYPDLVGPQRHRGFHIQELITVAWDRGWTTTQFQVLPQMKHGSHFREIFSIEDGNQRIRRLMGQTSAVLTGLNSENNHHAWAWDHNSGQMFDPARNVCAIQELRVESCWLLKQ